MRWIATWGSLVLAGVQTGLLFTRDPRGSIRSQTGMLVLATAAVVVVAWCANAGALLGNATASEWMTAYVPIPVSAGYRVATLWSTLPGSALTLAMLLLVGLALSNPTTWQMDRRVPGVLSLVSLIGLGIAVWFAPGPDARAVSIAPFLQSPFAAMAPLSALLSITSLAGILAHASGQAEVPRSMVLFAWAAATAAVVCEQEARSALGIGPRDAVVLGSASSGLLLWLFTSGLLHRRVRSWLRVGGGLTNTSGRLVTTLAHIGAACLVVSFVAHAFARRATIALPATGSVEVPDAFRRPWQFANHGVSRFDSDVADVTAFAVDARDPQGSSHLLTPEIREYHGVTGAHVGSISLRKSAGRVVQTVRVLLVSADSLDVASVRVTFLPFPILWSAGVVLLALSLILALTTSRDTA